MVVNVGKLHRVQPHRDNQFQSPPPRRTRAWINLRGLVLLLVVFGAVNLVNREPDYQGKTLTAWLDDLNSTRSTPARRTEATEAIQQMGAKAVPHLLTLLKAQSSPVRFRDFLEKWLEAHPQLRIQLDSAGDRSWQVVEAFRVLGPVGEPAMPALAKLLARPQTCGQAAACLAAIGTPAVPALVGALHSTTNRQMQNAVLMAFGIMGPPARSALPSLMTALATLDRDNMAVAAFALARIGPAAAPVLLRALTNDNPVVRQVLLTGLDPQFKDAAMAIKWPDPNHNQLAALAAVPMGRASLSRVLLAHFKSTNAAVRAEVARAFGSEGLPTLLKAAPALAQALTDENAEVRQYAGTALKKLDFEFREGGIIRGSKSKKQIALVFTGHTFGEGGETILNELARHHAKGSFFLTGEFLGRREFEPLIERILREGHYLGPHSDQHLLYCPWDGPKKTLVSSNEFFNDLRLNLLKIRHFSDEPLRLQYWLPAYEWYNQEIVEWSGELELALVNYTPGTRSNADYMEESDPNFVSSQAIYESIVKKEREDPHGLNGFLLLMHIGAGPGHADKMHARFGELLDYLAAKGYQFVRVDELLDLK